jgi:hypothetical protein
MDDLFSLSIHFLVTTLAVILGASISHWLEQEPTKPVRWRRGPGWIRLDAAPESSESTTVDLTTASTDRR